MRIDTDARKKENEMTINKGSVAYLCFVWAFALLLGVVVGLNAPFVLLLIGSVLYLIP